MLYFAAATTQCQGRERPALQSSEVIVSADRFGHTIEVALGDVIVVPPPAAAEEWNVDFAAEILTLLTPTENLKRPGPTGWRFRAIGAGETDVALTAVPPPCRDANPCNQPPPRHFVFTIRVHS